MTRAYVHFTHVPPRRKASTQLASQKRYRLSIGSFMNTSTILLNSPRVSTHFAFSSSLSPATPDEVRPLHTNGDCGGSDSDASDCFQHPTFGSVLIAE